MVRSKKIPLIYLDGGSDFKGRVKIASPFETLGLIEYGKKHKQKYMYTGYRFWAGKTEDIVVFDKLQWSESETRKREKNGFKSIFEHKLSDYR